MNACKYAVDGTLFETLPEARAFVADPVNKLSSDYQIDAILYPINRKTGKASTVTTEMFSECGSYSKVSEWMLDRCSGPYRTEIGRDCYNNPIYAQAWEE